MWNSVLHAFFLQKRTTQESETRMTASVPKQDPNTQKVQNNAVYRTKHNMRIVGVIPFVKLQNNT